MSSTVNSAIYHLGDPQWNDLISNSYICKMGIVIVLTQGGYNVKWANVVSKGSISSNCY